MFQHRSQHKDVQYSSYKYTAANQMVADVSVDVSARTHLAVCGRSFSVINTYFPELLPKVCVMGTVFARMLPDQKCQLIEQLQVLGYSVGMCGDGANDCEALKAAHAGISLSEAEASVAAPFTSQVNNIECVVTLMREGRAALVTSFGCFKYMALYSFIQFISIIILYTYGVNLSDLQFLYIDLIITTTIAVIMGYTKAYHKLVSARPDGSLVKLTNIMSILLQVLCAAIFQLAVIEYLRGQSWYSPVITTEDKSTVQCWESTVIFTASSFQYIVVAFCYSKGPPFRKPIYTNIPYIVSLLALVAFSSSLLLLPWKPFMDMFKLERLDKVPLVFRGLLVALVAGHFVVAYIIEYLVTQNQLVKACLKYLRRKKTKSQYKNVEKELVNSDWPPVGQVTYMSANHHENNDVQLTVNGIAMDGSVN